MTLTVQFKAKPYTCGGALLVKVPELKRYHASMDAFRRSRAFGGFANSDMFPAMLNGAVRKFLGTLTINADIPPEGVTVETGSLLATVTIELPDAR